MYILYLDNSYWVGRCVAQIVYMHVESWQKYIIIPHSLLIGGSLYVNTKMGFKCESLKIVNCEFFPEITIFKPTI